MVGITHSFKPLLNMVGLSVVKPIEYIARPHRLGLGGTAKAPEAPKKKFIKPGESREPKVICFIDKLLSAHIF